jgi:hypothetical protein
MRLYISYMGSLCGALGLREGTAPVLEARIAGHVCLYHAGAKALLARLEAETALAEKPVCAVATKMRLRRWVTGQVFLWD